MASRAKEYSEPFKLREMEAEASERGKSGAWSLFSKFCSTVEWVC